MLNLNPLKSSWPILIASIFGLIGCSQSPEEPAVHSADVSEADAKDDLASLQKNVESDAAKLKAEISDALSKQRKELLSELNSSTGALTSQFSGLKKQYDSLKSALPEDVLKAIKGQIPDLETSIGKLKDMVAKFNPKTLEDLQAFKTKYQKEYDIAQSLIKKASTLLAQSGVKIPKLF